MPANCRRDLIRSLKIKNNISQLLSSRWLSTHAQKEVHTTPTLVMNIEKDRLLLLWHRALWNLYIYHSPTYTLFIKLGKV